MERTIRWRRRGAVVLLAAALQLGMPALLDPSRAAVAQQRHVVRAGHGDLIGEGDERPFVHTAFYPDHLRVHRGDLVEWRFGEGYGGWHSVVAGSDGSQQAPRLFRADETPGSVMLHEEFGHGRYPKGKPCGRVGWYAEPGLEPCVIDEEALEAGVASSAFERFFATNDAGAFVAEIDLPPGTYEIRCGFHSEMRSTIEVVEDSVPLAAQSEIDQIAKESFAADRAEAERVEKELGDPRKAWNPLTREWTVHVGAETPDRRVGIYQFLPSNVPARRGDRVRFLAKTQEPNSVMFVPVERMQGGFNANGRCGATYCTNGGTGAPWGYTGLAYPWLCDFDGATSGAPGIPAGYLPPGTNARTGQSNTSAGCVGGASLGGALEFQVGPYMASAQRAPGDLVVDGTTQHNSGIVLDPSLPQQVRQHPAGGEFPFEFEAVFPKAGTFTFVCNAHEFMNGAVNVV